MAKWVSRTWQSLVERPALGPGVVPVERMLFPFATAVDVGRFTVTTDRVVGGDSVAAFSLRPFRNFAAGCFEGIIQFEASEEYPNGGFANVRTAKEHRRRLEDEGGADAAVADGVSLACYEGLAMRVKTDGRVYRLNLHCADHSPDDVYQMEFTTSPGRWDTLILPFAHFRLVSAGRLRQEGYELDPRRVDGMGILLADQKQGPFKLEVQWVKAIEGYDARQARRSQGADVGGFWAARAAHEPGGGRPLASTGRPGHLPTLPSLSGMPPDSSSTPEATAGPGGAGHATMHAHTGPAGGAAQQDTAASTLGATGVPLPVKAEDPALAKAGTSGVDPADAPLTFPAEVVRQAADAVMLPGFRGVAAQRAALAKRLESLDPSTRQGLSTRQRKALARADGEDVLGHGD